MDSLIIIGGCTGSGKSNLAVDLAKYIDGEIISADSMQIYKKMDIGTAKVTVSEMQGIPHHLIDIVEPTENFTVTDFRDKAEEKIAEIQNRGKVPIVVGGTGFYINSLLFEQDFGVKKDDNLREELEGILSEKGKEYLHSILQEIDPSSAAKIHFNNVRRVLRAIEVTKLTNIPFSLQNNEVIELKKNYLFFNVNCLDREKLYAQINQRVEKMMLLGLLDEVMGLVEEKNLTFDMQSMKGIGYKEFEPYLHNSLALETVVENIKQNTRNYAKRQITWFKRYVNTIDLYTEDKDNLKKIIEIVEQSKKTLRRNQI